MAKVTWVLAAVFACGAPGRAIAETTDSTRGKRPLPQQVAALRERGPDGLAEALRIYDGLQLEERQRMFSCAAPPELSSESAGELEAWRAAIDQIGAQR